MHTDNLAQKRSNLKERLTSLPKSKVIDENKPGILAHIHHSQTTEPDELPQEADMDYDNTEFMSDREDSPDDKSLRSTTKLTKARLSMRQSNLQTKSKDLNATATQSRLGGDFAASTIMGGDDHLETDVDTRMLRKSKNTLSKKSLKSVGVNEEDGKNKKVFNINQEDIEMLPNKSFYNSDGTKIKILGTIGNHNKRNNREAYAFSPLI